MPTSEELESMKKLQCDNCDMKFFYFVGLAKHQREEHDEFLPVKCDLCPQRLEDFVKLNGHKGKCHSDTGDTFMCDICDKEFTSQANMFRHMANIKKDHARKSFEKPKPKSKKKSKIFKCDRCDKKYYFNFGLVKHKTEEHGAVFAFECNMCHMKFEKESKLKSHQLWNHEGNANYLQCDMCDMKFKDMQFLNAHKAGMHVNVKEFKCDICDKMFDDQNYLDIHKVGIHGVSKPNVVPKSETRAAENDPSLLDIELYECDQCDMKYANKLDLHKHKQAHVQASSTEGLVNKPKPYGCDKCDMRFYYPYGLAKHRELDHSSLHMCDMCNKKFNSEKNLSVHKLMDHERSKYSANDQQLLLKKIKMKTEDGEVDEEEDPLYVEPQEPVVNIKVEPDVPMDFDHLDE